MQKRHANGNIQICPDVQQVWIEFGRISNRKCVDYFRVTYQKKDKTGVTTLTTEPIDRLESGAQMTVVPCTEYSFRIAAYEEFHGTGRRSDTNNILQLFSLLY